jgi:hypothetical protein
MAKRFTLREVPDAPDPGAVLTEIRRLYFETSAATIDRDFDRAIDLLKSLPDLDDRQKAHVYMEGLAEMRKEWSRPRRPRPRRG